ncbi:hypothetical protein B0T13DRAFT_160349 [Neurospora crassa]|nr:hypothetical protein B0T13DRAFT_160349 [Neurospora crassa]
MGKCLRALCDSLISYTMHKYNLTQAEKALEKRQAEYNKCTAKLADFPSVPELQKKYLDRDTKRRTEYSNMVRAAEDGIKRAREGFLSCLLQLMKSGQLPAALLPPASASSKEYDDKIAELEQALSSHKSDTQARINELQDRYDGLQSKRLLTNKTWNLDLGTSRTNLANNNESIKTKSQSSKKTFQSNSKQNWLSSGKILNRNLQSRLGLRNFKETQEQELKTQLAKQQKKYEKQLEQQLEQQRATVQDDAKQSSASEVASLRQELSDLRYHLGTREQELNQVRAQVAEFEQKMAKQEEKLENVDFVALDEAAEIVSFQFPALKDRVTDLETKAPLDILGLTKQVTDLGMKETNVSGLVKQVTDLETKVTQVSAAQRDSDRKLEDFQNKFAVTFGQLVDAERTRINKLIVEVNNLKLRPTSGTTTPQSGVSMANLEPLRAEFKQGKAEQQATLEELQQKTSALDFAISNLNQRFNNITSKHVADILIQQLLPETEKWKLDLEDSSQRVESLGKEVDMLKASVGILEVKTAGLTVELEPQAGMKRRRTDHDGTHIERTTSNTGQAINAQS